MRSPLKLTFVSNGLNKWFSLRDWVTEFKYSQKVKSSEIQCLIKSIWKEHSKRKDKGFTSIISRNKKWKQWQASGFSNLCKVTHFPSKQSLQAQIFFAWKITTVCITSFRLCQKDFKYIWRLQEESYPYHILPMKKDKIRLPVWIITWKFCWWEQMSLYKTKCVFSSVDLFQRHQRVGYI